MIDWLRWLGILPVKLFFSFNGEGAFICPMAFVLPVEETEWNSLFDRRCLFGLCCVVLRDGDDHRGWIFLRGGPSRLCPCDGVSALGGVFLRTRCSLFFSALVRQHAMVFNGTSHFFATSARSSPRAFSSSPGRICNILALSRTTLSQSSSCAEICILRMVLS